MSVADAAPPDPAVDVAVALGPDVQPLRSGGEADDEVVVPSSRVETHEGEEAERHAGDRSRQPGAAPEWTPGTP